VIQIIRPLQKTYNKKQDFYASRNCRSSSFRRSEFKKESLSLCLFLTVVSTVAIPLVAKSPTLLEIFFVRYSMYCVSCQGRSKIRPNGGVKVYHCGHA
jgi:hypothetical protein